MLSELDLGEVFEGLLEACTMWYAIGLKLGLMPTLLDTIRTKEHDVFDCLREMLWQWLQQKVGDYIKIIIKYVLSVIA